MPKVIVNSGYIKNVTHFTNYMEYSGNKLEAQALVMNDGTVQEMQVDSFIDINNDQLMENVSSIRVIFKDGFTQDISPDAYGKYSKGQQAKITESVLIGADGKEIHPLHSGTYIEYMGHRPSVGKNENEKHGLFDMDGTCDMKKAVQSASEHPNNIKWSHIISLSREDAERTGYDNRKPWEILIKSKAYDIAKVYNISPENLVIHGAYHDKAHHPHVHLFFYSTNNREGFVKGGKEALTRATERLKSTFTNSIFVDDVSHLKELKQTQEQQLKQHLQEITQQVGHKRYIPDQSICKDFDTLAHSLEGFTGRPYYGYLNQDQKQQVISLLRTMVQKDSQVNKIFQEYVSTHRGFVSLYNDRPDKIEKRMNEFIDRFYAPDKNANRSIHNMIVQHALRFNQNRPASPISGPNDSTHQELLQKQKPQTGPIHSPTGPAHHLNQRLTDVGKKENQINAVSDAPESKHMQSSRHNRKVLMYATNSLIYSVARNMALQALSDSSLSKNKKGRKKTKQQHQKIQHRPQQKKQRRFTPTPDIEY